MKNLNFINEESLEKVIDLTVHVFKIKYPRVYFAFADFDLGLRNIKYVKDEDDYSVLTENYIKRGDLKSVKKKYGTITEDESSILEGIGYEFKEPILNIEEVIDKQLGDIKFNKKNEDTMVIYEVEDSPILKLIVSPNTFLMEINRDKWEFRAP